MSNTGTPEKHIEEIRRKKFSIGGKANPLTEDNLSAEVYTTDVHFLMELIQVPYFPTHTLIMHINYSIVVDIHHYKNVL